MALKLMYITNNPAVALIAEKTGVDRIFLDMEYIGKGERQKGMDTVQLHHTLEDIANVRKVITKSEVMVRCNPIHDATEKYDSSETEINGILNAGADIIMLPFFKTVEEVRRFLDCVKGRARTLLLVETPESVACIDEILSLGGIDEVFIGLNDLNIGYHGRFMFELLADGTVEGLCKKFRSKGYSYGFGGIAAIGKGKLPAEKIIAEHYRLGSTCVILSRSFCDLALIENMEEVHSIFENGVKEIRTFEQFCANQDEVFFEENRIVASRIIHDVSKEME